MFTPYPFQIRGARLIERYGGRCLLADDAGLGKTITGLLYLARNSERCPALVVCPASLKLNWQKEASQRYGFCTEVLLGKSPPKKWKATADLTIINYEILTKWTSSLASSRFRTVLFDECHRIKSRTAKCTRASRAIAKTASSIIGISATPLVNRPAELFTILNLCRPDLFPSSQAYLDTYCAPRQTPWGIDYSGASNLDELHGLLSSVMIRRLKTDVLPELPAKRHSSIIVPLTAKGQKDYREAERNYLAWLQRTSPDKVASAMNAEALTRTNALRQMVGVAKAPAVCDWLGDRMHSEKVVAFGINVETLDAIQAKFKSRCVRVDGSTSRAARHAAVEQFQNDRSKTLFLANIQAAGVGLTLTAAATVAVFQLPWTPGELSQAFDRCHRITQTREVEAVCLLAQDTIEETVAQLLTTKQSTLDSVLDGTAAKDGDVSVFDSFLQQMRAK